MLLQQVELLSVVNGNVTAQGLVSKFWGIPQSVFCSKLFEMFCWL